MRIPIPAALKKIRKNPASAKQFQDFLLKWPAQGKIEVEGKTYTIKRSAANLSATL